MARVHLRPRNSRKILPPLRMMSVIRNSERYVQRVAAVLATLAIDGLKRVDFISHSFRKAALLLTYHFQ